MIIGATPLKDVPRRDTEWARLFSELLYWHSLHIVTKSIFGYLFTQLTVRYLVQAFAKDPLPHTRYNVALCSADASTLRQRKRAFPPPLPLQ